MDIKRQVKNRGKTVYREIDKIDEYQKKLDSFNTQKIKELTNTNKKEKKGILKDANGKLILNINWKLKKIQNISLNYWQVM